MPSEAGKDFALLLPLGLATQADAPTVSRFSTGLSQPHWSYRDPLGGWWEIQAPRIVPHGLAFRQIRLWMCDDAHLMTGWGVP